MQYGWLTLLISSCRYTLMLDLKSPVPLPASAFSVQLRSTAEIEHSIIEPKAATLADVYAPNDAFRLFRIIVGTPTKCLSSLHVTCSDNRATINVRALQLTSDPAGGPSTVAELGTSTGLGCATLMAVNLEPTPPPAGKGQEAAEATTVVLECEVDRLSALELCLPSKPLPPPPEGEEPTDELGWTVTAVAAAAVTLTKDSEREQALAAMSASWESAQPGRAVKAKETRQSYLSSLAPPPAPADEATSAVAEEEEGGATDAALAEAEAATTLAEPDTLANVKRHVLTDGTSAAVLTPEELEDARATQAATLEDLATARTETESSRSGIKDAMQETTTKMIEAAKASRTRAAEAHAGYLAERESLLEKLLPAPPEPVEPIDAKGGKGKKGK